MQRDPTQAEAIGIIVLAAGATYFAVQALLWWLRP